MSNKDLKFLDDFKKVASQKNQLSNAKLRVGIIGTGWIAGVHLDVLKKMKDIIIVGGADIVEGKAEKFFADNEVENVVCYTDHKKFLAEQNLDAVCICTYNATHAECAIDALNAGVHTLLEKPMTVTLEEAIELVKVEKKSGKILTIGIQPRMDANMQKIKSIVQSGNLGKVYYIQTGGGRRRGIPTPFGTSFIAKDTGAIGALGDIGCYSLDMVLNAINYPKPLTVSGYKSAFFGTNPSTYKKIGHPEYAKAFEVDDFSAAFIRLEGDIILDFRIAWAMNLDTSGDTIIMGDKGSLRIPSTECWNGTVGGPMTLYHEIDGSQVETIIPIEENEGENIFYKKLRSFFDAIRNDGVAPVSTNEIIYNQAIIDAIVKSAELGREVEIDNKKIDAVLSL